MPLILMAIKRKERIWEAQILQIMLSIQIRVEMGTVT